MNDRLVVIDTSIWIEYFRGKNAHLCSSVEELIAQKQLITLNIITAELLRGARAKMEKTAILETIDQIPKIELDDSFWIEVGLFCQKMALKGYNIHLIDGWIAKAVVNHNHNLWSLDKHFEQVSKHSSLKLWKI